VKREFKTEDLKFVGTHTRVSEAYCLVVQCEGAALARKSEHRLPEKLLLEREAVAEGPLLKLK
jgi:hypothetical protein